MFFPTLGWRCLPVLLLLSCQAFAQSSTIGYVKTVGGDASLVLGSDTTAAVVGMPIQEGHILKTGNAGGLGVVLKDNTSLSLGSNSEMAVRDFLYLPGKDALKLELGLVRGTLYYISGVIAKLRPDAVAIKTPTGMIGVRGTQFLVLVDPEDAK
ncbi:FecR family protein [Acidovorax soli]|uniref:FecR family protein n=1 Tax=Acidovorax soli TaxID=592050 RepID=UPI0032B1FC2F